MSSKVLTKAQVIARLKKEQGDRTNKDFAAEIGISAVYLGDIYAGKRDPGNSVLEYFKLEKVPAYAEVAN